MAKSITPVQQKHTLAAKKQTKKSFKLILSQPYQDYWPELKPNEIIEFKNIFKQSNENELRKLITFGIPSILRNLQNENLKFESIVLSKSFQPHFVLKQIINLIILKNKINPSKINIIVVPELEKITEDVFGFQSYGFGISNKHSESLGTIVEKLSNLAKLFATKIEPNVGNCHKNEKKRNIRENDYIVGNSTFHLIKTNNSRQFIPNPKQSTNIKKRKLHTTPPIGKDNAIKYLNATVLKIKKQN